MSEIDVFASAHNTYLILSMNVQATAPNASASQVQAPAKRGRKKLSDDVNRQRQEVAEQVRLRK